MVITKIALARRTFLHGVGASLALPLLDAMAPALTAQTKVAARFAAIYVGNGANMSDWTPPSGGVEFAFSPTLKPLEAFRDQMLVVTGLDNFQGTDQGDVGGQHSTGRAGVHELCPSETNGRRGRSGRHDDRSDNRRAHWP